MVRPRARGILAKSYQGRFGTQIFQDSVQPTPQPTPRTGRKPGLTQFTDPQNPFARPPSKRMAKVEDIRSDPDRAGCRTRNPAVIPCDSVAGGRQLCEDGRYRLVPHRYGSHEWRPSKRCPDASPGVAFGCGHASPRCSAGVAGVMDAFCLVRPTSAPQKSSMLENYLNDMKRCKTSLKYAAAPPSPSLRRMNDERVKLPSERRQLARAASFDQGNDSQVESDAEEFGHRSRRMAMRGRNQQAESDNEDNYGFGRKRAVSATWSRRTGLDFLHHQQSAGIATPRMEGGSRAPSECGTDVGPSVSVVAAAR